MLEEACPSTALGGLAGSSRGGARFWRMDATNSTNGQIVSIWVLYFNTGLPVSSSTCEAWQENKDGSTTWYEGCVILEATFQSTLSWLLL